MIKILDEIKNFVRPSEHSTYSPSAGDRWLACPGSINASRGIPDETSVYAREGTLAHSVCEAVFYKKFYGIEISKKLQMEMLNLPDQGEEMMECAEAYVEVIESWLALDHEIGKVLWFGIERGIPIFPELGCFGTGDCVIIGDKGCAIIDFKYGKGKEVKGDSIQLKLYALGIYNYVRNVPDDYQWNAVVYQPRINAIPRVGTYDNEEMKEFGEEVYEAIQATRDPNAELFSGNHCYWCPAKRTRDPDKKCPIVKQEAVDLTNENFDKFLTDMNAKEEGGLGKPQATYKDPVRDQALLKILSLYPIIKDMAESAETELLYRIQEKGESIPGCMVRDSTGRRKWKHDKTDDISSMLRSKFPSVFAFNETTKTKTMPLSITEVKKLVGKKKKDEVDKLTVQPLKKQIYIDDNKTQEILNSLTNYSRMIRSEH